MSTQTPKPRRAVQVDLSGLTDRQVRIRQGVVNLGETVYGPRWQSDLAAALSAEANRRVGQAQVSHWISGFRPVPEMLIAPLTRLALKAAADMERRADRIRTDWAKGPPGVDIEALSNA